MGIRSTLSRPLAKLIARQQRKWSLAPGVFQKKIREQITAKALETVFGGDHGFKDIHSYEDFKEAVPVRDYEALSPYIHRVLEGDANVLWPGKPDYLAKTSGTTSGIKYIPVTKDSIPNHIDSARNALLAYVAETGHAAFLDGKLIFLSGSPTLEKKAGINTGRLSGIVNHHVPAYLRFNQMPSYETNCVEDWELKIDKIVQETMDKDMTLISGIPPWVQMYFDKLIEKKQKPIKDIFPNFSLFVYGGVNFEPYKARLYETIGKRIGSIELYPASEGFLAYQDRQDEEGMLLLTNSGIFFEFIPTDEYFNEDRSRLSIDEVETGVTYAVIINSNAGLWGYSIGDTVKFVNLYPHRIIVSGRIKHFISAFGEHVIGEEVEKAMRNTCRKFTEVELIEFTVAPQVNPKEGLPYHEWLIAFAREPNDPEAFKSRLDAQLRKLNTYYEDLIAGSVLRELEITSLKEDAFIEYMKSIGKLGGQNKIPRLSNDRKIADGISRFTKI